MYSILLPAAKNFSTSSLSDLRRFTGELSLSVFFAATSFPLLGFRFVVQLESPPPSSDALPRVSFAWQFPFDASRGSSLVFA